MLLKGDVKLQIEESREELGINNPNITSRVNLYSLNRVLEMMLQYLMIHSVYQNTTKDEAPAAKPKKQDHYRKQFDTLNQYSLL